MQVVGKEGLGGGWGGLSFVGEVSTQNPKPETRNLKPSTPKPYGLNPSRHLLRIGFQVAARRADPRDSWVQGLGSSARPDVKKKQTGSGFGF